MNQEKNMDYQNIPRELFTKVQVDQGERERIGRPSLTAWQDGWIRLKQNKAAVVSLFIIIAIVALAITGWVNMARLVRARILQLKNQEFVMAAEVLGTSQKNIILRHLIPNTVGIIVINAMFTIPSAIFTEAFLSFIGIGLSEPQASLGVLINNGYSVLQSYPYLLICPAIVIILIMVCFSILGDGLRDALDPRMSK